MITTNEWIKKYRNDNEISALAKTLTISETVIDDLINIMLNSIRDVSMIKWKVNNINLTKDKLKNIIFVAYHYALINNLSENDAKLWATLIANSILRYGSMSDKAAEWINNVVGIMKEGMIMIRAITEIDNKISREIYLAPIIERNKERDEDEARIRKTHNNPKPPTISQERLHELLLFQRK